MTNKKRKGFTIVELVIVIAVIAILAGVLIPTFASIIDKANQSADIQAVRQMNVVLMAESVEDKPTDVNKVIKIVSEAGYDTVEKRTPKSSGHGFYWHSGTNTIVLVKGTSELVYPNDNETLNQLFEDEDFTIDGNFNNLAVKGENTNGDVTESVVNNPEDLIAALTDSNKTGTITLGDNILLSRDENELSLDKVEILCAARTDDTTLIIDLNGKTLTIGIYASLVIEGKLKIIDTANDENTDIIIPYTFENFYGDPYYDYFRAFYVLEGGTLSLENLDIDVSRTGQMGTNIYNEGDVFLTNTDFTLNSATDIYNVIAFENRGDATIKGGSFVAKGTNVQSIKNYGQGTLEVTETSFKELTEDENGVPLTISYCGSTPLYLDGDEVIFNSVDVEIISEEYYIDVKSPNFTINGGSYKGKIGCTGSGLVIINDGEFYDGTSSSYVNLKDLTIEVIKNNICFADYNIILSTITDDSNNSKTTCQICNYTYMFNNTSIGVNDKVFIHLSQYKGIQFTEEKIDVFGTLDISGGRLYTGSSNSGTTLGKITANGGTIKLDVGQYYKGDVSLDDNNGFGAMIDRLQITNNGEKKGKIYVGEHSKHVELNDDGSVAADENGNIITKNS